MAWHPIQATASAPTPVQWQPGLVCAPFMMSDSLNVARSEHLLVGRGGDCWHEKCVKMGSERGGGGSAVKSKRFGGMTP